MSPSPVSRLLWLRRSEWFAQALPRRVGRLAGKRILPASRQDFRFAAAQNDQVSSFRGDDRIAFRSGTYGHQIAFPTAAPADIIGFK